VRPRMVYSGTHGCVRRAAFSSNDNCVKYKRAGLVGGVAGQGKRVGRREEKEGQQRRPGTVRSTSRRGWGVSEVAGQAKRVGAVKRRKASSDDRERCDVAMEPSGEARRRRPPIAGVHSRMRGHGTMVEMSFGEELLEQRRRRRRAGDPRLSDEGKELFRRMTTGDLMDEFQATLDAVSDADPLVGGGVGND